MKIPAKIFRIAFEKVAHLAGKRSGIPILSNVLVSAKSGTLSVSASDNIISAASECPCIDHLEPFCVSATSLGGILNGAGDREIDFTLDGQKLRVTSPFRATIPTLPAEKFAPLPAPNRKECLGVNCEDLAAAIRSVYWAADPKDVSRAYASAVRIATTPKNIICTALDGHMLAHCETGSMGAESDVCIPCHCTSELTSALSGDNSDYFVSEKYVFAVSDGFSVSVRRLDLKYVDVQMVLGKPRKSLGTVAVKPLKDELALCKSVMSEAGSFIRCGLAFSPTGLEISSEGQERDFHSSVAGELASHSINVNLSYMSEVIKHFDQESIKVEIYEPSFLILSGGDLVCGISLLASPNPQPKAQE